MIRGIDSLFQGRGLRGGQLCAFDHHRSRNVFIGELAQFTLRSDVGDGAGVCPALLGLISQMDGAFGHGATITVPAANT